MTETRLIELEMLANANAGTRSAPLLLELVAEVRRLQKRSAKRSGFVAPEESEVEAYFAAGDCFRNGTAKVKASEFIAFYAMRGWKLSKGVPMVSWKSACDLWENRAKSAAPVLSRQSSEPRL